MAEQWHFDPDTYLAMVRSEIRSYDELQERLAEATADVPARRVLDLGSGTGETARRVLSRHPGAELVGVDASAEMLRHARALLPEAHFRQADLADPLPEGPFDLVVSAFAVHHLNAEAKSELFTRVAEELGGSGRFVLLDVVVPSEPVAAPVPLDPGIDLPDTVEDQLRWLTEAGLTAGVVHAEADLAILRAEAC